MRNISELALQRAKERGDVNDSCNRVKSPGKGRSAQEPTVVNADTATALGALDVVGGTGDGDDVLLDDDADDDFDDNDGGVNGSDRKDRSERLGGRGVEAEEEDHGILKRLASAAASTAITATAVRCE